MKACQDIVLFCSTAIVGWSKAFLLCDCILAITDNTQENWQSFYSLSEIVSSIKIMLTYKASINVYVCQSNATWLLLSRSHARSHGNICTQSLMYKFTWVRLAFIGTCSQYILPRRKKSCGQYLTVFWWISQLTDTLQTFLIHNWVPFD